MESQALIEVYDYTWYNDFPDTWGRPVRLDCQLADNAKRSLNEFGQVLDALMRKAKTRIRYGDLWQSSQVALTLQNLANSEDVFGISLYSAYTLGYHEALWRILVSWDHEIAEDGYYYMILSYKVEPTEDGSQMERLERVDWESLVEQET